MMTPFRVGRYHPNSLLSVYSRRGDIQLDPAYQRISGIWNREKRQLLLDSLLNGFDVPKLYFHAFTPPRIADSRTYRYAIIDGKQRLEAIWDFIDGSLRLAPDFSYLRDDRVVAGDLTYSQLAKRYPKLKARFDTTLLDIVTIHTEELDVIEDLFSRLNEAVPLNAPEKRNAFGGPLPPVITRIAGDPFFTERVPFADKRYRYRDLAAKFLYLEFSDGIVNTKKADLDTFVRRFKNRPEDDTVQRLTSNTESTLTLMASNFETRDPLLRQVGMITLYYHLFRFIRTEKVGPVSREMFLEFEARRVENRGLAERDTEEEPELDPQLLEFDTHSQTPNDAYALRIRLTILLHFLNAVYSISYDDTVLSWDN